MQQYLPFTVLKRAETMWAGTYHRTMLQQYLPFTVLKLPLDNTSIKITLVVVLQQYLPFTVLKRNNAAKIGRAKDFSCNSIYRLRY